MPHLKVSTCEIAAAAERGYTGSMEAPEANEILKELARRIQQSKEVGSNVYSSPDEKQLCITAWNSSNSVYAMFFIITQVKHPAVYNQVLKAIKQQKDLRTCLAFLRLYHSDVIKGLR